MEIFGQNYSLLAIYWCVISLAGMIIFAHLDGTLTGKKVNITLFKHMGIFWGYIPMAIVNGLIIPQMSFSDYYLVFYAVLVPFSLGSSYLAHKSWWPKSKWDFCPTMPNWDRSGEDPKFWYRDMRPCGWLHLVMFAVQIFLYFTFFCTAMPMGVVVVVFICTMYQFPVGIVQPYLMAELKRMKDSHPWARATFTVFVVDAAVAALMAVKLHFS